MAQSGRHSTTRRVVAAVVVVMLVALSLAALSSLRGGDRAEGLAGEFDAVDTAYLARTQQFADEARELDEADLRTTLRLYGVVLDAAQEARRGFSDLDVLDSMETARERLLRALDVQIQALEQATSSARAQDPVTAAAATRDFQAAALAYQTARLSLVRAIEECGERCR